MADTDPRHVLRAADLRFYRCGNPSCRVEVYKGHPVSPFNECPVCLDHGITLTPTYLTAWAETRAGLW